jgi:signal transduction histidine kinase
MDALAESHRQQQALLAQLHAAQADLQRAVRMRDDFMSLVSHELRTPLNTLYLDTQTRKLQLGRNPGFLFTHHELQKMVERDSRQIQSMVRLIDDMLDVSRMRSGSLSIRPQETDLVRLVAQVADSLSHQAEAARCTLRTGMPERPIVGLWDAFRIEQIVVNLLTNAMRYGAGKPIDLRVAEAEDGALVEVRDHGVGIAPEDQERVFQQFERARSGDGIPGLGLGLFISRQIAAAHGGRLSVESTPGSGATFRLHLPLRSATEAAAAPARADVTG